MTNSRALRLTLLTAGWTTQSAGMARRGAGHGSVRFPALVGVVEHPDGVVLFDTGYAPRVITALSHGIDRVYKAMLPVHVTDPETAAAQLIARGIDPADVTTVVLSHLHVDHIGGLRDFPAARVVVAPRALDQTRRRGIGRLRRGLLPFLLPTDLPARCIDPATLPPAPASDLDPLPAGRDLLGDGTLVVVPMPGHSAGHLGMLVRGAGPDVLLVGDAVWNLRAATHGELPHPIARMTTDNWRRYRETAAALGRLTARRPDLLVVPAHDEEVIAAARGALAADTGDASGAGRAPDAEDTASDVAAADPRAGR